MGKKMMGVGAFLKAGGGSYEDYMKAAKAADMEYEDEDTYKAALAKANGDDDEDEDEEDEDEAEKAEIDSSDLRKSLEAYEAVEDAAGPDGGQSRLDYLEARFHAGTISKSEKEEFGRLLAGDAGGEPLNKSEGASPSIEAGVRSDGLGDLVDGSDLLKSLFGQFESTLEDVIARGERGTVQTQTILRAQGGLIKAMAAHSLEQDKALNKAMGVIDALAARLNIVERQPAPRRSQGHHDPRDVQGRNLAKSGRGGSGDENTLTKSQAQAGIRQLIEKADGQGDDKAIEVLVEASARLESGFALPARIEKAVRQELGLAAIAA